LEIRFTLQVGTIIAARVTAASAFEMAPQLSRAAVARILGISAKKVFLIEKRAMRKLRANWISRFGSVPGNIRPAPVTRGKT
jgi:hypothetical protein